MVERDYSKAWFTDHLARAGKTPADLFHFMAERFGLDRIKVNKMRNGIRRPQIDELPALLAWLNLEMDTEEASQPAQPVAALAVPTNLRIAGSSDFPMLGPRDVPVHQIAVGGDEGDFIFSDEALDYVRRPPGLAGQRVIAAFVTGVSMQPKFEPGDPIYAYVGRPAVAGDYVIVELHPEAEGGEREGFIKRLVKRTSKLVTCEQFNPSKNLDFPAARVRAIYKVVPQSELLGM